MNFLVSSGDLTGQFSIPEYTERRAFNIPSSSSIAESEFKVASLQVNFLFDASICVSV